MNQKASSTCVGEISAIYPERGTARVLLPDFGLVTKECQIAFPASVKSHDYRMPEVGETVLVVFLDNGHETGFIIGYVYNRKDPVPVASADVRHWSMEGAGAIELDRANGSMTFVDASGSVIKMAGGDIVLKSKRNILLNPSGDIEIPPHLSCIFD